MCDSKMPVTIVTNPLPAIFLLLKAQSQVISILEGWQATRYSVWDEGTRDQLDAALGAYREIEQRVRETL